MGCYIDENTARDDVKEIVDKYTTDYQIFVQKRRTEKTALKRLVFVVIIIYDDKNYLLYDSFIKHSIESNNEVQILESATFFENGKKKEAFHVECIVEGA